jgi:hypothetical protein
MNEAGCYFRAAFFALFFAVFFAAGFLAAFFAVFFAAFLAAGFFAVFFAAAFFAATVLLGAFAPEDDLLVFALAIVVSPNDRLSQSVE